jgi:hypothetical protein
MINYLRANYQAIFDLPELTPEQLNLFEKPPQLLIKFLQLARANNGSEISFNSFYEAGINAQELLEIYLVIQLEQGHDSIRFSGESLIYSGK